MRIIYQSDTLAETDARFDICPRSPKRRSRCCPISTKCGAHVVFSWTRLKTEREPRIRTLQSSFNHSEREIPLFIDVLKDIVATGVQLFLVYWLSTNRLNCMFYFPIYWSYSHTLQKFYSQFKSTLFFKIRGQKRYFLCLILLLSFKSLPIEVLRGYSRTATNLKQSSWAFIISTKEKQNPIDWSFFSLTKKANNM